MKLQTARQPTMMETMKVSSGVTLMENGSTKPGNRDPPDPNHPSRKDFIALMSNMNMSQAYTHQETERPVATGRSERQQTPEWFADATPVVVASPKPMVKVDVNEILTTSKDWGLNPPPPENPYTPPRRPFKPSERQRQETLGSLRKEPRDRPFSTITGLKKSGTLINPLSPTRGPPSPGSPSPLGRKSRE